MEDDEEPSATPPRAKPSQVPSWITLGFVLGAIFVAALPKPREKLAPPPPEPPARLAVTERQLTTIEAVFDEWEQYAVWTGDLTQVAMWNAQTKSYSDCYEVLRIGGNPYFRSIPALTRPVLTHGVITGSPLQFTESPLDREKWLGDVKQENWRQFSQGVHDSLAPAPAPKRVEPVAPAPDSSK